MVYNEKIDNIYFCGDIHGDFKVLKSNKEIKDAILIVCGDVGLGFSKDQYYRYIFPELDMYCHKHNIHIYFVRGNHDDPSYFDGEKINYNNIKAIPDYSVITTPNHNILCIGGAISIDRSWRKAKHCWNIGSYSYFYNCSQEVAQEECQKIYWSDEVVVYDEEKLNDILNKYKIDIVATHTAPSFVFPHTDLNSNPDLCRFVKKDINLIDDIKSERETMNKIYEKVKPTNWFYGHFHDHCVENYENTKFHLLDMCKNGELDIKCLSYE